MKRALPFVSERFSRLARKAGVKVVLEDEYGYAGQIVTNSGRRHYFLDSRLDINTLGATEIAADKDYAAHFMRKMGYPVPEGEAFFSRGWAKVIRSKRDGRAALRYATKLGFPVFVKPNSKSRGLGVVKARTRAEFERAYSAAEKADRVVLVQRPYRGKDYRVVVIDGRVISAYERRPLTVTGNGRDTISNLLTELQKRFKKEGRDTIINLKDWRIARKLSSLGLTMRSIPEKDSRIELLDNANLSAGGESFDVTETMHPKFKALATNLTRDMGLRLCGVDLMIEDGIEKPPRKGGFVVIEINAAPGLDHYASYGKKQQQIVDDLYLEILKSMNK